MKNLSILILALFIFSSCATKINYKGNENVYNEKYHAKIIPGKTTEQELNNWFGAPESSSVDGREKANSYGFAKAVREGMFGTIRSGAYIIDVYFYDDEVTRFVTKFSGDYKKER
jgi:hypothetical protein